MPKLITRLFAVFISLSAFSQNIQRPKLVVGIVVDQMRWDFLYRYYDRYSEKGFKRLINEGYSCDNTMIPYTPTTTASGHTSIYTGSVPSITGITGNTWWDYNFNRTVYCTEDSSVKTVGSTSREGFQSPRNLLTTTIGDELRLATNFRSKVIGIALKDRGGILPAGHTANAAYWYDDTNGNWITSSYYMNDLPSWVKDFNSQKLPDKYYKQGWNTLYPINSYIQSTEDDKPYETKTFGVRGFPYDLNRFIGVKYNMLETTPFGNSLTEEMAKAAISNEQLGKRSETDFITVSFSSTDYIGHAYGPNSIETEDTYLRLDKDLGDFIDFLDQKVGKGQYLLFLSADHGVAHVPAFAAEHHIPSGNVNIQSIYDNLNAFLKTKYKQDYLVTDVSNYQVYLNLQVIEAASLNLYDIESSTADYLQNEPGISRAFVLDHIGNTALPQKIAGMITNGFYPKRSGQVQMVFEPQWIEGFLNGGTTHGIWNPYDAHIPLLWYGWNIKPGKTNREIYMTDIAPTIAGMLHIQMPSGCIGKVIDEILR